jgi:hypothetical protein
MSKKPGYKAMIEDQFRFRPAFFKEHQESITVRLLEARQDVGRHDSASGGADLRCLATNLLVRNLGVYADTINKHVPGENLRAAMLHYVLKSVPDPQHRAWSDLRRFLDKDDWYVGTKVMNELDIPRRSVRPVHRAHAKPVRSLSQV